MHGKKANIATQDRLKAVSFDEFCEIAKVGRSRGYQILNSGVVRSVLVGRTRLVLIQTWYTYLERLLAEQPNFTPGRRPGGSQAAGKPAPAEAPLAPSRRRGRPPKYSRPAGDPSPAPAAMAGRGRSAPARP